MNIINKKRKTGFTLIELLVVISIISLLSSIILVAVSSVRQNAKISKAKSEMSELVKALEIYRTIYGKYPDCGISNDYFCEQDGYDTTSDYGFGSITTELKDKKIYSGNLVSTIQNVSPNNSPNFTYISKEYGGVGNNSGQLNLINSSYNCGNKSSATEYYLQVTFPAVPSSVDFSSSYWSKEYRKSNNSWDNNYCVSQ